MLARLAPGEPLPPERSLAESFSTSRTTVRQALHELTIEGRLVRMQGRGTFAALPKIAQPLALTSYTEDMRRRGPGVPVAAALRRPGCAPTRSWPGASTCATARGSFASSGSVWPAKSRWQSRPPTSSQPVSPAWHAASVTRSRSTSCWPPSSVSTWPRRKRRSRRCLRRPRRPQLLNTTVGYPMLLLTRHSRDSDGTARRVRAVVLPGRPLQVRRPAPAPDRLTPEATNGRPRARFVGLTTDFRGALTKTGEEVSLS